MKTWPNLLLMLVAFNAYPASMEQDLQDQIAESFKSDSSLILIRNDTTYPVELRKPQLGKYLICLTSDFKKFSIAQVVVEMFRREETALARCQNGRISISRGYL